MDPPLKGQPRFILSETRQKLSASHRRSPIGEASNLGDSNSSVNCTSPGMSCLWKNYFCCSYRCRQSQHTVDTCKVRYEPKLLKRPGQQKRHAVRHFYKCKDGKMKTHLLSEGRACSPCMHSGPRGSSLPRSQHAWVSTNIASLDTDQTYIMLKWTNGRWPTYNPLSTPHTHTAKSKRACSELEYKQECLLRPAFLQKPGLATGKVLANWNNCSQLSNLSDGSASCFLAFKEYDLSKH